MASFPKLSVLTLLLLFMAVFFGQYLYTQSPYELHRGAILMAPSSLFPLGSDRLGRDLLARLIEGGKVSLLIGIGSFFLIGCGGSGAKNQSVVAQLKGKDKIVIYYNYPPDKCVHQGLKDIHLRQGFKDIITSVESNDVSCAVTFDRTHKRECEEVFANQDFSESCLVGYNR